MAAYFIVMVPLVSRIPLGLYESGVWGDAGFVPYEKIARMAFLETPEISLVLVPRGGRVAGAPARAARRVRRGAQDHRREEPRPRGERGTVHPRPVSALRSRSGSSEALRSPTRPAVRRAAALVGGHQGPLVVVASALAGVTDLLLDGAHARRRGRRRRGRPGRGARCSSGTAPSSTPAGLPAPRAGACWPRSTRPRASTATSAARWRRSATCRRARRDLLVARGRAALERASWPRCSPRGPPRATGRRHGGRRHRRPPRQRGARPRRRPGARRARVLLPAARAAASRRSCPGSSARAAGRDPWPRSAAAARTSPPPCWRASLGAPGWCSGRTCPASSPPTRATCPTRASSRSSTIARRPRSAYFGAQGAAPARAHPARGQRASSLHVRSFLEPEHARHRGLGPPRRCARYPVKALATIAGQALVTVAGKGMMGVPGIAARTFAAVHAAGLSVSTIFQASSESSIGFTLPARRRRRARWPRCAARSRTSWRRGSSTTWPSRPGVAVIAVVGERHGRHARHRRARLHGAGPGGST